MRSKAADPGTKGSTVDVLVVGGMSTVREAAISLEPVGVTSVLTASGEDALAQVTALAPDLVVIGGGDTQDMSDGELVRQLRARSGTRPPVVVIGSPTDDSHDFTQQQLGSDGSDEDYLPADVGVPELVAHIFGKLNRVPATTTAPVRPAVSQSHMAVEIERELKRAELAGRPGLLAQIDVAEVDQLRKELGPKAEQVLAESFDEMFASDAHILEQHSMRDGGGFHLLMPETSVVAGRERLQRLSRRVASAVVDVAGENVHVTPVIGYASFTGAKSADELRDQATIAVDAATRHLDLVPVGFSSALAASAAPPAAKRDVLLALMERLRSPLQIAFTSALLVLLPFLVYVIFWYSRFDLTTLTYPLVAALLAVTAAALWIESFRAVGPVDVPDVPDGPFPTATAIVAAYLPNEAATIVETVTNLLAQDYPGELQVILAYNTPQHLPVEDALLRLAGADPRLMLLRVLSSTSKAQNVNAALAHVRGEFVGVFDADHHPAPGSFSRAWRWLSSGHDIVQGHCVVRNGEASWVARMVAVEFETIYAVSHPGRARFARLRDLRWFQWVLAYQVAAADPDAGLDAHRGHRLFHAQLARWVQHRFRSGADFHRAGTDKDVGVVESADALGAGLDADGASTSASGVAFTAADGPAEDRRSVPAGLDAGGPLGDHPGRSHLRIRRLA